MERWLFLPLQRWIFLSFRISFPWNSSALFLTKNEYFQPGDTELSGGLYTLATSLSTVSRSHTSKEGKGEERVNEEGYKLEILVIVFKFAQSFCAPCPSVISSKHHSFPTSNQLVKKIVLCYLGEIWPQESQTQNLKTISLREKDLMRPKVAGHVNEGWQAACSQTFQPLHCGGWWVCKEPKKRSICMKYN